MTEYTRPATWEDVTTLARYLDEADVEYALVGGYALGAHGFNRFTEDIDILVDPSPENSKRWLERDLFASARPTGSVVPVRRATRRGWPDLDCANAGPHERVHSTSPTKCEVHAD